MATVTLNMSTRNPITLDLAAGWSLQSTVTATDGPIAYTIYTYVSATPKRVIAGQAVNGTRGETKYAGYLNADATCLTTTLTEFDTIISELKTAMGVEAKLAQDARIGLAATTIAA